VVVDYQDGLIVLPEVVVKGGELAGSCLYR
jgi:hypothetical protein